MRKNSGSWPNGLAPSLHNNHKQAEGAAAVKTKKTPKAETQRMPTKSLNRTLHAAKAAKQDEFYTQFVDIQKEVEAYLEYDPDTFRGKVVYCNCDDPFESNFFKYFASNFNNLGLKRLITTSYDGSPIAGVQLELGEYSEGNGKRKKPKAIAVILDRVKDEDGDGAANVTDVELFLKRNKAARKLLKADGKYPGGDFRSEECIDLLKQADIVVTNPPFSLFREYVAMLVKYRKKFLIIGNQNAISYKDIFKLIKETKIWLGNKSGDMAFRVPDHYGPRETRYWKDDDGKQWRSMGNACWFTNLDHGLRHQKLECMTLAENLKFSRNMRGKSAYERYANYDAIEVPTYKEIPSDFSGAMGVPITFLDKYNPKQFEILGSSMTLGVPMSQVAKKGSYLQGGPRFYIANGDGSYRRMYDRIVIRHRQPTHPPRRRKK